MKWFTHDVNAMDDIKLVELQVLFGDEGYSTFFKFLELQGREEAPIKLNAAVCAKMMKKQDRVTEIVREAVRLGLFDLAQWRKGFVFSPNLEMRADNYSKRKRREETSETKPPSRLAEWSAKIEEAWHKTGLPRIVNWSGPRREKLDARIKNEYFREHVVEAVEKMGASAFCNGNNDRKWTATIDFLLANDNNFVKALEGRYDDRGNENEDPLLAKYGVKT